MPMPPKWTERDNCVRMEAGVSKRMQSMTMPTSLDRVPMAAAARPTGRVVRCVVAPSPLAGRPALARAARAPPVLSGRGRLAMTAAAARHVAMATGEVDVEEALLEIEDDAMTRMDKCISTTKSNFSTIRTGRATPNMLDRVEVEYYGAMTPIKSLAGISTPDASTLTIQPFDQSSLGAIERAIMTSDLDLTPNNDGKIIRIRIPALTEERRKEMTKKVGALAEEGKVAVRNVRRDTLKALGKLDASEDAKKGMETEIQKLTDGAIKQIDEVAAAKNKDLTTL
eukprot:jgi/Tetstr1/435821/TSEL_024709.t1